jgi:hypothetical protein
MRKTITNKGKFVHGLSRVALGLGVISLVALAPGEAHATALGDFIKKIGESLGPAAIVIEIVSYIAGAWLGFTGLMKLKSAVEHPQQHGGVAAGVARLVLGGLLIALPAFIGIFLNSFDLQAAQPSEVDKSWNFN